MNPTPATCSETALVMPGGGSRAAYQVGVLKALAEATRGRIEHPFPIICGTSAGALNAVGLASRNESFSDACHWLENLWLELTTHHVYRSDWLAVFDNFRRLILSLFNAGVAVGRPIALLDNRPLRKLLSEKIDFSGIARNLQAGHLDAVCVTALNYTAGVSESFYQGGPAKATWKRWRRQGVATPLQLRHLMASTAIPTIFPPQRIGRNYYGDGALRQLTPLSPALHLGAQRVLIISASGHNRNYERQPSKIHSPALGQVVGHLLNSAFIDSLETDIELLKRVNELVELIPPETQARMARPMRRVESEIISPSQDIDQLAADYVRELPRSIKTFLRITGGSNSDGGVNVASYLLFTESFCKTLIELGYRDGKAASERVMKFLSPCPQPAA